MEMKKGVNYIDNRGDTRTIGYESIRSYSS